MGNQTSQLPATGKVILLDGSIQEFDQPFTVAELMLEYPQQVVVELRHGSQTKPVPLPADQKLEVQKVYLMVPLRRGKPAHLSPQEAHNILLRANQVLRSKTFVSSSKFLPFFARICPASTQDVRYSKFELAPRDIMVSEGREMEMYDEVVDEGMEQVIERPDYLSRQFSSRGWKPNLDPIEEKKDEIKKGPKLVVIVGKVGKRIHSKGLVWG